MLGLTTTDSARLFTDEEVLARAKREPWLFGVILERYQDAFLRKAESVLHSREDAEEVVQDAFTKIYLHIDRFEVREGARFSSWAYKILMNTAFTRYQRVRTNAERFAPLHPDFEQFVKDESLAEPAGRSDAIDRVLARLPGHFAQVLRLHYLERWPHKDIADAEGETVGAVKARIHRAKEAFRKEAKEGEVELLLQ